MKNISKLLIITTLMLTISGQAIAKEMKKEYKPMDSQTNKIIQTAGRDVLGDFAPEFAHYNDDILFGENWNTANIDTKTKSIVTVVSLMSQGIVDSSMEAHLKNAKKYGVTKSEIAGIITHNAFYAGWPKAWAVFRLAKNIWTEDEPALSEKEKYAQSIMFPVGEPNDAFAKYFSGKSYAAPVSTKQVKIFNITFEPGCRNNWHIHKAKSGGGQMLIGVGGKGYYQEWGKEPVEIKEGTVINIPANVKHWHGAAPDSWFSHLAVELDGVETSNEWLEPVDDEHYRNLR